MILAYPGRLVEASARVYRRTWRGSVISTFLNPVLFLLAMGVGLGKLVDAGAGDASLEVAYLTFLAPGLLASTAMTTAAGDSSFPVMAGIKWRKTYEAILATPIGVADIVAGHLGWIAVRLTFVTLVYAGVMTLFGATSVLESLLAVPPGGAHRTRLRRRRHRLYGAAQGRTGSRQFVPVGYHSLVLVLRSVLPDHAVVGMAPGGRQAHAVVARSLAVSRDRPRHAI